MAINISALAILIREHEYFFLKKVHNEIASERKLEDNIKFLHTYVYGCDGRLNPGY